MKEALQRTRRNASWFPKQISVMMWEDLTASSMLPETPVTINNKPRNLSATPSTCRLERLKKYTYNLSSWHCHRLHSLDGNITCALCYRDLLCLLAASRTGLGRRAEGDDEATLIETNAFDRRRRYKNVVENGRCYWKWETRGACQWKLNILCAFSDYRECFHII